MNADSPSAESRKGAGLADGGADAPPAAPAHRPIAPAISDESRLAIEIRGLVDRGAMDEARARFSDLVAPLQRRRPGRSVSARRLRPRAVQDAFVKAITSYRRRGRSKPGSRASSSMDAWITARRTRRDRGSSQARFRARTRRGRQQPVRQRPEHRLLARERRARIAAPRSPRRPSAHRLYASHYGDYTPRGSAR